MSQRLTLLATAMAAMAPMPAAAPMSVQFRGTEFVHRWSKAGQNEFTPAAQPDLAKWQDMVTVNTHEGVKTVEQLDHVANSVLGNFQRRGKVLRTATKPRTATHEAEHLIVAVLGDPGYLEAAFVRCVLVDGVGYATVYSHRIYGAQAGPAMSQWLAANGGDVENALMTWAKLPAMAELRSLPQAK